MSKKIKIILLGLTAISALLIIVLQNTSSINQTNSLQSAYISVIELEATMLRLIRHEKDFQLQVKNRYQMSFNETFSELTGQLNSLIQNFSELGISTVSIKNVLRQLKIYHSKFNDLVAQQKYLGFDESLGLWNELETSAINIESAITNNPNDILLAQYWLLRRHEQAFLMHGNIDFQIQFSVRVQLFDYTILEQDITTSQSALLKSLLITYENSFTLLVGEYQKLGLDQRSGLRGELIKTELDTEVALSNMLEVLRTSLGQNIKSEQILSVWNSAFLTIFVLILIVLMLVVLTIKDKPETED